MSVSEIVESIQQGKSERLEELTERFRPLVIVWLKKTGELYGKEREDLESMAKIVLLEAVQDWTQTRGVPFQSFYKMRLWNWYGNYRRKKRVETISLEVQGEIKDQVQQGEWVDQMEEEEKRQLFNAALGQLNETEQKIMLRICEGFTIGEIAESLQLESKKVSGLKYQAMKKLKNEVEKQTDLKKEACLKVTKIGK